MIEFSAEQVASFIGGFVDGDAKAKLFSFAKIEEGRKGDLCFLANMAYEKHIYTTEASAVIVDESFKPSEKHSTTLIRVKNPYEAFAKLMSMAEAQKPQKKGISNLAFIAGDVKITESCYVGEYSVIHSNTKIGERCVVYPQVFIGENVKIGDDVILYPGVKIMQGCEIGNRCIIHAGTVIGSDGFGFALDEKGEYKKIPQTGNVVLEDDVEIGANTTIDRATMGSTKVGKGSKLDNLIQVAHNVELGKHNVFAAQAGIAGSCKFGDYNQVGGQVGFAGHLKVGSYCKFAAQSGIKDNVQDKSSVMGAPAMNAVRYMRVYALFKKLDDMAARINKLEKK